jgi:hypothetical protein
MNNPIVRSVAVILYFAMGVALAVLGYDWITIGHGLNPYIAFPTSAIAFVCVGLLMIIDWRNDDFDVEYGVFQVMSDGLEVDVTPAEFPCGFRFETIKEAKQAIKKYRVTGQKYTVMQGIVLNGKLSNSRK